MTDDRVIVLTGPSRFRHSFTHQSALITRQSFFVMPQLKIAAVLAVAIILQLSLRAVWSPLSYIDFPLIVVVYIALQRHAWQALIVGNDCRTRG